MQHQFNKLLLATVISASVVTSAYGATDGNAAVALDQRAQASADAAQALQDSPDVPLTTEQTLDTAADARDQATQHISAATQTAGTLQQALTTDLDGADAQLSATANGALAAASELSGAGGSVQEQIQGDANHTADAVISDLRSAQMTNADGTSSARAGIAGGSSVAGKLLQMGQTATASLSNQTSATMQDEVRGADTVASGAAGLSQSVLGQVESSETAPELASGQALPELPVDDALPAAPDTSLPTPEVAVNSRAQADVSAGAGLTADAQRVNLNTQQRMQTDVGFSSAGRGNATTTLGSSIGGSVGGITSGTSVLGTGSLLR